MNCIISELKNYLKIGVLAQALICLLSASALLASAQDIPTRTDSDAIEHVQVYINDVAYPGRAVLYENTTYVDLHEFTNEVNLCRSSWQPETETAFFVGDGIEIAVINGTNYLEANGRYLWCRNGVFVSDTYAYVPIRVAAQAFGADVFWNAEEFAAYLTTGSAPILSGDRFYNDDEVLWMSRIIYAEAGVEPFDGKIAVGNVVLNRVRDASFPNTIYGVIFDRSYGVQFTPTANGTIYCNPSKDCIIAAKICLEGSTLSPDILYFLNPAIATNLWVPQNREYVMTISGHDFYS